MQMGAGREGEKDRGDGLQIGREIVRLMHFRPRSSISIDLDLGHGEGRVWKVESLESLRCNLSKSFLGC